MPNCIPRIQQNTIHFVFCEYSKVWVANLATEAMSSLWGASACFHEPSELQRQSQLTVLRMASSDQAAYPKP
eukprot:3825847-Amphidinium_carterae.1